MARHASTCQTLTRLTPPCLPCHPATGLTRQYRASHAFADLTIPNPDSPASPGLTITIQGSRGLTPPRHSCRTLHFQALTNQTSPRHATSHHACLANPLRAIPCPAAPDETRPRLACQTVPNPALTRQTPPRCTSPCKALPALPSHDSNLPCLT